MTLGLKWRQSMTQEWVMRCTTSGWLALIQTSSLLTQTNLLPPALGVTKILRLWPNKSKTGPLPKALGPPKKEVVKTSGWIARCHIARLVKRGLSDPESERDEARRHKFESWLSLAFRCDLALPLFKADMSIDEVKGQNMSLSFPGRQRDYSNPSLDNWVSCVE